MKLILDIDSVKYPLTGIGRYVYELARIFRDNNFFEQLVLIKDFRISTTLPTLRNNSSNKQEKTFKGNIIEKARKNEFAQDFFFFSRKQYLSAFLAGYKDFIYHGPSYFLPPFSGPKVVTIHDLSSLKVSQFHQQAKADLVNRQIEYACSHADCILTVSEFSKQELVTFMSVPGQKIRVTPNAASHIFYPRAPEILEPVLRKWKLTPGRYTLFTGTLEPRKNVDILLNAYDGLSDKIRRTFPLVICGYRGWKSDALHERIKDLTEKGWVKYFGYAAAEDLSVLMAGAALFLFPSFYEGFGLPPLEAMQSGIPVIVSNRTALPEVVGDSGMKLHPQDVDLWRQGIIKGLEDNEWREKTICSGLKRSKLFSWRRCALETMISYAKLANR